VRFYERLGYKPAGQRPGYYDDGLTALLFARHLPDLARFSALQRRFSRAA
jgi:ribosomal protein S18 acetylase RimI-like enzyme